MNSIGIVFILLFTLSAEAQVHAGARFTSMAHAAVALQDVWSVQQNQAGLCGIKEPVVSLGSIPSFLGNDIKTQAAVIALPYRHNVFGLSFQRYGITEYNEQKVGLTYARSFNSLFVALHGNYHQLYIQNYGSAQRFSIEAGLQYWASQNLCLGIHIANPNQSFHNSSIVYIPRSTQVGASYRFSDQLMLAASVDQVSNNPLNVRAGLEYNLIEWFALRGGVSVNPLKQYVGLGIHYSQFRFDIATASHTTLGYAPQLALSYAL